MISKFYSMPIPCSLRCIAFSLQHHLEKTEHMDVRRFRCRNGHYILHGQTTDRHIRRWLGLQQSVEIRLCPGEGGGILVHIDASGRKEKICALLISLFLFWPLLPPVIWGSIRQALLPRRIERTLRYLLEEGT